jgi:serine protease Do
MKRNKLFFGISFLLLGLFIGVLYAQSQSVPAKQQETPTTFEGFRFEDAVINVANTAGKAVVSISTEQTTKIRGGRSYSFSVPFGQGESPFGEEDPFRRYFDDFFGQMPDREYKSVGLGSGVIIDPEGYILTNEHVIDAADKITVTLSDGREFKGEVKGKDIRSDLAVIKVNAHNLPVASLGDSNNLKIGQWVVAIGNPFGFALQNPEPTVTAGVIGALHRSLGRVVARDRDYSDLIQTDAAINPGNSGGPLVNLKGEVVGINVAIFSTSGGYQGVGFAIPINNATRIIANLKEGKKILYGWLGVTVQDLNVDLAKYFGVQDKKGVLIAKVLENGPAQKAGIKESDIIKQFDNKPVNNVRELLNVVALSEVGKKVKVVLMRDKKEMTVELSVGERPQNLSETEAASGEGISAGNWRGLEIEGITPENSRRFRIEEKAGVVVVNIEPNSAAEEAGLIPGEVILEINKQPVNNKADYDKITRGLKGNALVRTSRGYFLVKGEE